MTKTASTTIRIDPKMKKRLQELAQADRRSLSAYIEIVLEAHLDSKSKANA
ncbi:MAG: ribbon-helix-helix protein, CopG family [Pseudomonadota bacterium]